jgi:hypothetical protein
MTVISIASGGPFNFRFQWGRSPLSLKAIAVPRSAALAQPSSNDSYLLGAYRLACITRERAGKLLMIYAARV